MTGKSPTNKSSRFYLAIAVLVISSLACSLGGLGSSPANTPVPATPVPGAVVGDYGDAPDGDHNMDTGYYAPSGGPFLFTYESVGVAGNFPTMGDDPIPGAFTVDVDEFWIGPLFGGSEADVPSLEDDVNDPNDPDNVANLLLTGGGADCDAENGSHNPGGNGCAAVPAYSLPMNARLMIFFGYPPLGVWFTSVTASEDMSYSGPVYWNLLFDLNQDGDWEDGDEWIAQDIEVSLAPGETVTLISPAFRFPTSGTPWGRLNFPYWVRSMVSSESIAGKLGSIPWDGRGTADGFAVGEVEDYFVEWMPIGQKFPNGGGSGELRSCVSTIDTEQLEAIPSNRNPWDLLEVTPGVNVKGVRVLGTSGPNFSGAAEVSDLIDLAEFSETFFPVGGNELIIKVEPGLIQMEGESGGGEPSRIFFLPGVRDDISCAGSVPVVVTPGLFQDISPPGLTPYGFYDISGSYAEGDKSHDPFTIQHVPTGLFVDPGQISAPPPFVPVDGDIAPDGTFLMEGRGIIAGYPDIRVQLRGTFRPEQNQMEGLLELGVDGGLPGGQSITYQIEGLKAEDEPGEVDSGPPQLPRGAEDTILSFTEVFNNAFVEMDPETLFKLLHPGVVELYGEEACRTYLDGVVETPTSLAYQGARRIGPWTFERDGASVQAHGTFEVFVDFTANGQTNYQELHLTLPGDDSVNWFTDCGDPLVE